MGGSMASGSSVQWTGQERELSSHAFPLTLTFPTTDGAMAQGDSSWVKVIGLLQTSTHLHFWAVQPPSPQWLSSKEICHQCRRHKFNPWVRKILWRRKWQRTPVFLPGEFHEQRSLAGYSPRGHKELDTTERLNDNNHYLQALASPSSLLPSSWRNDQLGLHQGHPCFLASLWIWPVERPWGLKELDTTERLHFHFSLSCIGEGNGNPLQCSWLENPRDSRAWRAAVFGVAQSQTRLKWLSSSSGETLQETQEREKKIRYFCRFLKLAGSCSQHSISLPSPSRMQYECAIHFLHRPGFYAHVSTCSYPGQSLCLGLPGPWEQFHFMNLSVHTWTAIRTDPLSKACPSP